MKQGMERAGAALLSSRYTRPGRSWTMNRAALYADRIVLSELGFRGLRRREILLSGVDRVEWWSLQAGVNLGLFLHGEAEPVLMRIEGAGNWKHHIDRLLPRKPDASPVPGATPFRHNAA